MVFKKIEGLILKRWCRNLIAFAALSFAISSLYKISDGIRERDILFDFILSPQLMALVFGVALLATLLRGERLFLLMNAGLIGGNRRFAYSAYFYGLMLAFTPARSAELLRFAYPGAPNKVNFEISLKIFVLEKILDIFSVLLLASLIFIGLWLGVAIFFIGLCFSYLFGVRLLGKSAGLRMLIGVLALSTLSWIFEGLVLFFVLGKFSIHDFSALDVVAGFSLSSLVGALSFVPGGILVSEAAFLELLQSGSGGLFAVVLIFRLIILFTNFCIGSFTWLFLLLKNR